MAKKTVNKTEDSTDDFFGQLVDDQNAIEEGAAAIGDEMFSEVKKWSSTGSSILNTIISNSNVGGWPCGRIVELYGEEAIGKSTLVYAGFADCQKQGGIPIYFDIEQAGAKNVMIACGVDLKRMVYSGLTEMETIFAALEKNLQSIIDNPKYNDKPVLVCMDSLAQMSIGAEVEGDYEHNMNTALRKAQQLGKALRKIVPFLNKANACLIIINQQRDKPGVMFGDPKTTPGGNALKFAASLRIKLKGAEQVVLMDPVALAQYENAIAEYEAMVESWKANGKVGAKPIKPKKDDFKGDKIIVGYDVEAFTVKNKIGPPKRAANFRIMFGQGIIEEEAWFDYALKYNIIQRSGNKYEIAAFKNDAGVFSRDEWLETLADSDLREKVKSLIVDKLIRPLDSGAPVVVETEEKETE